MKAIKNILLVLFICLGFTISAQATSGDTTITKEEFLALMKQKDILSERNLMVHDYRKVIIKNRDEIAILNDKVKKLTDKITKHNLKLKKSQDKYRILIN